MDPQGLGRNEAAGDQGMLLYHPDHLIWSCSLFVWLAKLPAVPGHQKRAASSKLHRSPLKSNMPCAELRGQELAAIFMSTWTGAACSLRFCSAETWGSEVSGDCVHISASPLLLCDIQPTYLTSPAFSSSLLQCAIVNLPGKISPE